MNEEETPRVGRQMWKRFVLGGVLIVLLTGTAVSTAALLEVKKLTNDLALGGKPVKSKELTAAEAGKPQTILVLGSDVRIADRRRGVRGNSDTMLLVRLDPNKHATALLSIPRDLKVQIPHGNGLTETAKINAAYPEGGPNLVLKVIKRTLHIKVNHIININFKGFRQAVDHVHCVYADIDRRYFNDNAVAYATIDVKPGYQRMCGSRALDYVRFRHEDTDLVRAARQQDFLRQAKDQVGVQKIVNDRDAFAKIFGRYTETDIRGVSQVLRIFKLAAFLAGKPVREVHFQTQLGPSFVESTPQQLKAVHDQFLNADSSAHDPRGKERKAPAIGGLKRKKKKANAQGLENAPTEGENQAIESQPKLRFPVLYPRVRLSGAVYTDVPRTYSLPDFQKRPHQAYRMVLRTGELGAFYGIQGMTWKDPPLLANPQETQTLKGGRKLLLFFVGDRLRTVGFKTRRASYWVSNTLLLTLTNKQMVAIASSMQTVRG